MYFLLMPDHQISGMVSHNPELILTSVRMHARISRSCKAFHLYVISRDASSAPIA